MQSTIRQRMELGFWRVELGFLAGGVGRSESETGVVSSIGISVAIMSLCGRRRGKHEMVGR